jgi:glycosyltransferase involved in cell wall biosynthesis
MLISVVTTTYNTNPSVLNRTWSSIKSQSYTDWEWIVWDDSTNTNTYDQLNDICGNKKYEVEVHKSIEPCGIIGKVKRQAFMVSNGDILVELDHDDELTPDALQEIHDAFLDPEVGFAYSDWCEPYSDGTSKKYPQGWGMGFGTEYWSDQFGVWVMKCPPINSVTLSHIVGIPNHVRAWRASTYRTLNGHDSRLCVADDYDLVIRTAAMTKTKYIPKMIYKQHATQESASNARNALIQQLVPQIRSKYPLHVYGAN